MRILLAVQGQWGQRIATHLSGSAPHDWQIRVWHAPEALPTIIDDPEEWVPDCLAQADLLIVLTESAGLTDLSPDLAQRCKATAVLLAIDKRPWAPRGLVRQVRKRLESMGVAFAAPMPFCSIVPNSRQHPMIQAFSKHYGRPELRCSCQDSQIQACDIVRETPCGNTRYIAQHLSGTALDQAVEQAGLLHHYYPCWGGMEVDPVQSAGGHAAHSHSRSEEPPTAHSSPDHSPLHVAATMAQRSVARAIQDTNPQGDAKCQTTEPNRLPTSSNASQKPTLACPNTMFPVP